MSVLPGGGLSGGDSAAELASAFMRSLTTRSGSLTATGRTIAASTPSARPAPLCGSDDVNCDDDDDDDDDMRSAAAERTIPVNQTDTTSHQVSKQVNEYL